jgi:hypothetical protein
MRDENPIPTARRISRRAEQGRCSICGRNARTEDHHVAGRHHDATLTAPLCRAHHDQLTEDLRVADVDMRYTPDSQERLRRALKATAVFLWALGEGLWRWAEALRESEKR